MDGTSSRWSARKAGLIAVSVALLLAGFSVARATLAGGEASGPAPTEVASPADPSTTSDPGGSTQTSGDVGGGGSVNNEVVLLNLTDGRFAHRARFGTARVTGGDVTNTNSAAATSSCSDCRTVAVAVQIVLVMRDSAYIAPRNQAVAINNSCLRCESYALAYQYVVSTGGIVHFTPEGQQRLAELEAQISHLTASDLGFLELEARIDAIVEQMWSVVDEEVVRVGMNPRGSASKDSDRAQSETATSPAPSESPTGPTGEEQSAGTEPEASPSPSDDPEQSTSPSPSVSPEPTSSPTG
jgi:putative peptide zinc metalloprotease protein